MREGMGLIASSACIGPIPLRCDFLGLRGIGPALAGNVGAGWAFALSREGDQDVDVPMLAPARSRCRLVVRLLGWRLGWVVGEGRISPVP